MGKYKEIIGIARYHDIEGGFWGIEDNQGQKYTPINMPEQLKQNGARVKVMAEIVKDAFSLSMWGETIRIEGFETLSPGI